MYYADKLRLQERERPYGLSSGYIGADLGTVHDVPRWASLHVGNPQRLQERETVNSENHWKSSIR